MMYHVASHVSECTVDADVIAVVDSGRWLTALVPMNERRLCGKFFLYLFAGIHAVQRYDGSQTGDEMCTCNKIFKVAICDLHVRKASTEYGFDRAQTAYFH